VIDAWEWLASRAPQPPQELSDRLCRIAEGRKFDDVQAMSRFFIDEAEALFTGLCDDRSAALDLLVADSLITYAIEAAADDCASLDAFALEAMQRLAAVPHRGATS